MPHILDISSVEKMTEEEVTDAITVVINSTKRYPYDIMNFIKMCKLKNIQAFDKKVYEDMLDYAKSVGVTKEDITASLYLYTGAISAFQKNFESQVMDVVSDIDASTIEATAQIQDKIDTNNAKIRELSELNKAYFKKVSAVSKASNTRKNKVLKLLDNMYNISNTILNDIKNSKDRYGI